MAVSGSSLLVDDVGAQGSSPGIYGARSCGAWSITSISENKTSLLSVSSTATRRNRLWHSMHRLSLAR